MPQEEPAAPAGAPRRPGPSAGLPSGPPYFAGRRRELAELRSDIDRPGLDALRGRPTGTCRVLLVAGRPGAGRTALAVRLARTVAARYPDGVYFARLLGPDGTPRATADAAADLLAALPWRTAAGPVDPAGPIRPADPVAALRAALTGRAVALVLDDVGRADQVLPLLPAGPDGLVIATSAGPLPGVPDVRPCTLGGLEPRDGVEVLSHVIGEIRITVDPAGARGLAEACEGNPSALRMVAAWLSARPRTSLPAAARALREAARDGDGVAARALRVVHDTFPAAVARALRLLAVAPEGLVDAQVVSALAGTSLAAGRETVLDFAAHGLLHPEPDGRHRVPGWVAPWLRALLAERERPAEVRLARARMLERNVRLLRACLDAADPADPAAAPRSAEPANPVRFAGRREAAEWLRSRLPALLAGARAAVADGELDTLARRLIAGLIHALDAHGHDTGPTPQRRELHGMLLAIAERRGVPADRAAALINLADLDMAADRVKEAVGRYRAALHEIRGAAEPATAGRAMEALAHAYLRLGDPDRSADWLGRALALHQSRGAAAEVARLHGRLGHLHGDQGRFDDALREWRSAAAVRRRSRDLPGQVEALVETARIHQNAGHAEEALRVGHEALRWARQGDDTGAEATALLGLADLLDRLGDRSGARLQRQAAAALGPDPGRDPAAGGPSGGPSGDPATG